LQASPSDPENFPFVVIGNKIDVDGGNSRVVGIYLIIGDSPWLFSFYIFGNDLICHNVGVSLLLSQLFTGF